MGPPILKANIAWDAGCRVSFHKAAINPKPQPQTLDHEPSAKPINPVHRNPQPAPNS